jgi:hypothetical protein
MTSPHSSRRRFAREGHCIVDPAIDIAPFVRAALFEVEQLAIRVKVSWSGL